MPYLIDGHNLIPKLGLRLDSPDDENAVVLPLGYGMLYNHAADNNVEYVQADLTGALGLLGEAEAEDEGGAGDVRECSQENSSGGSVVQGIG